ncbi:MAG: YidC/Oxa1 family membrane protein insertase [Solirubrobacteraceae bacterium]
MLIDANIFQPLMSVFEAVIKFFQGAGISWGWSIILLTVCVRGVMMPLTFKQFHSMRRLQAHQPEMKALQKKYKGDKQRQQQEMLKFYKENNVNPMASCLPMVLQLPVFVALYYMLRDTLRSDICASVQTAYQKAYATSYAVKNHVSAQVALKAAGGQTTYCTNPHYAHQLHAGVNPGFLFIHDITNNPTGLTLVVLMLLYVGTQMVSTTIMTGPTMDSKQRKLMMFMPVVFVLFIIHFPAGLIVYWITSNGWTMGQQFVLRTIFGRPQVANSELVAEQVREDAEATEHGIAGRVKGLLGGLSSAAGSAGSAGAAGPSGERRRASTNGKPRTTDGKPRAAGAPPPPSPRKKKKRSGRRR